MNAPPLRSRRLVAAFVIAAAGSLATTFTSCAGEEEAADTASRSAILVTLDTTRWDALSAHGVHPGITPRLDALAGESVRYEFAHTVAPLTLPSHASMLTGYYPPRHTIRDNGFQALPSSASTLAEAAHERGHQTAAFVASTVLDQGFGLDQGFDTFSAPARPEKQLTTHFTEKNGVVVVNEAVEWLGARDRTRPFFLWVHLFDPHEPYDPPTKFRSLTKEHADYYGEVAYVDEAVGILLDALRADKVLDESTLLVVADHGESLREHKEVTHSHFCYEATLRVPFLLRYPDGYRAGEVSPEVVSVVDVYPTLVEAMGIPVLSDQDGHSLFHRAVPEGRGAYFESYSGYIAFGWSPIAGWIDDRGKYIHSSAPEYFDVATDAAEVDNLLDARPDDVREHRRAMVELTQKAPLAPDHGATVDPNLTKAVQGLGYAASGPLPTAMPNPLETLDLPSPASMVDTYYLCQQGLALADAGRFPDAIKIFNQVLEKNPRNWLALERLGLCYVNMQRPAEAIPPLLLATKEGPQRGGTYYNLGISLFNLGQYQSDAEKMEDGVTAVKRAVALDPGERVFLSGLVTMLQQLGREAERLEYEKQLNELRRGD